MKKTTLTILLTLFSFGFVLAQTNLIVTAPNGTTTTQVRAPNGLSNYAYLRASALVLGSELTGIPTSNTINTFGFITTGGADVAVTGTMTVYMKNSSDLTFTLGTSWSSIITGMTAVYTGPYTIPAGATNIDLTLTTPFTYTGGSIYVAYDFSSAAPFATTPATYSASSSLAGGCVSANNATTPPTTLGATSFRPSFRFGYPNPNTNDMAVESINTLGNVATTLGTQVPVSALVRNKSNTTLTNINVTANMTGANTYNDTKTVTSLAPGASTTVNFANWTPTALGANVLSVSVPSDQVNTNNSLNFNTTATCYTQGAAQNPTSYSGAVGFNTGSGIISTPIQNTAATSITGVNIAISSPTESIGNTVFGVVLSSTGAILAQSSNLTLSNSDLGTIKTFTFSTPVSVAANQMVYIGLGQNANATTGYFPIGAYTNNNLTTSYYTCALAGGALTLVTSNLGQIGIEANFGGNCVLGIDHVETINSTIQVYPNPTNAVLNVKLDDFNKNGNIEVYDMIGKQVLPAQKINGNTLELNVSTLAKGIYFLKVHHDKGVNEIKFNVE